MTRRMKSIVGDRKKTPLDYVASFAHYLYTEEYKERLTLHAEAVQLVLDCKARTARNYALALVFVDLIFDEFHDDLIQLGLSKEQFDLYMKNELLPSIKPLHEEPSGKKYCMTLNLDGICVLFPNLSFTDHIKLITRWLRAMLKMTETWSVSDCLNYFRLVSSKKTTPPGRCLAVVNDPNVMCPNDPMSIGDFGTLVSQYGGLRSFATMLKRPTSDLEYVTVKENGLLRRCCIIPFSLIKSDVWISLCLRK